MRALGLVFAMLAWAEPAASEPTAAPRAPAAVLERLARDDVQGALTELDALSGAAAARAELRYLKARLLERLGRLDEALAALPGGAAERRALPGGAAEKRALPGSAAEKRALPGSAAEKGALPGGAAELGALPEPVRAQVRALRALWLARLGRCGEAQPLLAELEADAAPEHSLRAAECALATGDAAAALARFERTPTSGRWVDAVAVGLSRAETLRQLGRRAEAAVVLRRLYVERPEHAASAAVLGALLAAGGSEALSFDERLARAARFMQLRAPARALAELDALSASKQSAGKAPRERAQRAAYLHARGMALYGLRTRYAEAARVLDQAARLGGPDAAEDAFHAARALSRADQDGRAVAAYRRLARTQAGTPRAAEAEFLAAWLELRAGKARGARELGRIADAPGTPAERRRSARFELGMYQLDRKNHGAAQALFAQYAAGAEGAMTAGRGLYWAARAAQLGARPGEAERLYRQVLAIEPLHWYALLARQRLAELGLSVPAPFEGAPRPAAAPPRLPALALPETAAFFAGLGLFADARAALRDSEAELMLRAAAGRGLEALVRAYQGLGEYARPLALTIRAHPELQSLPADASHRWLWDAAYPRPHAALVESLERAESLPVGYLHAIMRKESSFDPHVVSYADAIGLMQLLPATAHGVGRSLGLEVEREALFDPELNLRLSARFNAELLQSLGGAPVLAIAAYNAGAHRVRPWLVREARHGQVELDRFVERIPIEQTRNYVRRVVTNWARYLYLAAPEPRGWPLTLPLELELPR
jgi:soluble lytic murein transglycosylase